METLKEQGVSEEAPVPSRSRSSVGAGLLQPDPLLEEGVGSSSSPARGQGLPCQPLPPPGVVRARPLTLIVHARLPVSSPGSAADALTLLGHVTSQPRAQGTVPARPLSAEPWGLFPRNTLTDDTASLSGTADSRRHQERHSPGRETAHCLLAAALCFLREPQPTLSHQC